MDFILLSFLNINEYHSLFSFFVFFEQVNAFLGGAVISLLLSLNTNVAYNLLTSAAVQ